MHPTTTRAVENAQKRLALLDGLRDLEAFVTDHQPPEAVCDILANILRPAIRMTMGISGARTGAVRRGAATADIVASSGAPASHVDAA